MDSIYMNEHSLELIKKEDTNRAPVILFVFNRENHVKQSLKALEENYLAAESVLYVFSDAAISGDQKKAEGVKKTRSYIKKKQTDTVFKRLILIEACEHKGLADSIIDGVTKVMNAYGRAIIVEDDVLVTRDFLNFMNDALDFYREDPKVWSITGVGYDLKSLKDYTPYVYLSYRGGSECWASWSDRWEKIDWEVKDYDEFIKNRGEIRRFNRGGNDMVRILKLWKQGKINSWAIRWDYAQYKADMRCVRPRKSFMCNIGYDNSGEHSTEEDPFKCVRKKEESDYRLEPLTENKKLVSEFKKLREVSIWKRILIFLKEGKQT